jgi:hypothetical protein
MITSGITSGALTMPENSVRPLKRRYFTSAMAASVPSTTDEHAVKNAIFSESHRPDSISVSVPSAAYHFSVKPRQTLGTGESLNEYSTSATIGRYRKTKPSESQPRPNQRLIAAAFTSASPPLRPGTC